MKKLSLIAILSICLSQINGQIILEHEYQLGSNLWNMNKVYLDQSGYKYYFHDDTARTITLYNLDHSVFKNISYSKYTTDPDFPTWTPDVVFLSEKLFDTDPDVDFILNFYDDADYAKSWVRVINENGTVITEYTKCVLNSIDSWSDAIFNDENNAKMMLISFQDSVGQVFNLPGKLACLPCSGSTSNVQTQKNKASNLKSFPNPAKENTTIEYQLPEGLNQGEISLYTSSGTLVKTYKVDNKFNSLIIKTIEMKSGIYFYDLHAGDKIIASKKLVVIK